MDLRYVVKRYASVVLLPMLALLSISCNSNEIAVTEIELSVGEWFIAAPQTPIASGEVLLRTENAGALIHDIEVFRKDSEFQEFEIGEFENIAPGEIVDLQLPLEPGNYELICTIVEKTADGQIFNHYDLGMHTTLTVTER